MWTVVKIKKKELNIFKKNLTDKIGQDIEFYYPKIEYHKNRSEEWNVTVVNTGEETMTGGRLKRVAEFIGKL